MRHEWPIRVLNPPVRRGSPPSNGFTLIELLVVIGIIAILASMLLPALRNAQMTAQSALCMSNIKQLNYACQFYMNDWNNAIPSVRNGFISSNLNWWELVGKEEVPETTMGSWGASGYIPFRNRTYTTSGDAFKCPAAQAINPKWLTIDRFSAHYSMNNNLFPGFPASGPLPADWTPAVGTINISIFPKPSETIFLGDGTLSKDPTNGYYFTGGMSDPQYASGTNGPYIWRTDNPPVFPCHNMSANISFLDMHVENRTYIAKFPKFTTPSGNGDEWRSYWKEWRNSYGGKAY